MKGSVGKKHVFVSRRDGRGKGLANSCFCVMAFSLSFFCRKTKIFYHDKFGSEVGSRLAPNVRRYAQLPLQGAFVSGYPQGKQLNQHEQPFCPAIAYTGC
jgi:hypothetical protein